MIRYLGVRDKSKEKTDGRADGARHMTSASDRWVAKLIVLMEI